MRSLIGFNLENPLRISDHHIRCRVGKIDIDSTVPESISTGVVLQGLLRSSYSKGIRLVYLFCPPVSVEDNAHEDTKTTLGCDGVNFEKRSTGASKNTQIPGIKVDEGLTEFPNFRKTIKNYKAS